MSNYTKINVPAAVDTWSTRGTTSNTQRLFYHGFPYGPNGFINDGTGLDVALDAPDNDYVTVYWVNHVMNNAPAITPLGTEAPNYKADYWGLPYFNPRFGPPRIAGTNKKDMSLIVFDGDPALTPPGVWAEDKDPAAALGGGISQAKNVSLPPIIPFVPNPALPEGTTSGYDVPAGAAWGSRHIFGKNAGVTAYFISQYEKVMGGDNVLSPAESIRDAQYGSPYNLLVETSPGSWNIQGFPSNPGKAQSSITMPSLAMGKSSYTVANTTIL